MFGEKWSNPLKSSACNVWIPRLKMQKEKINAKSTIK